MKKQSWRQGQTYAERRKSYTEKYNCPTQNSKSEVSIATISSSIHVVKVPSRPSLDILRLRGHRCYDMDKDTPPELPMLPPDVPNPTTRTVTTGGKVLPLHIPHKDIRSQITSREDAECPRPPPNTPPRKSMEYRCGDFTYDIPLDDQFARELFQQSTEVDDVQLEDDGRGDGYGYGWHGEERGHSTSPAHRQSQSSVSLPLSPSRRDRGPWPIQVKAEDEFDVIGGYERDRSVHTKPPSGCQLRWSTLTKVDSKNLGSSNPRGNGRVLAQQRPTTRATQNPQGSRNNKNSRSLRIAGGTQSHSDLEFVHNPRIAKFLEEIKAAKEKKEAGAYWN